MFDRKSSESSSGLEFTTTTPKEPQIKNLLRRRQSTAKFAKGERAKDSGEKKCKEASVLVELNFYNEATKTKTEEISANFHFGRNIESNIRAVLV